MSTPSLRRSKRRASSSVSQVAPSHEAPASQAAPARTPHTKASSTTAPPAKRVKVQPNATAKGSTKASKKASDKEKQEAEGIKAIAAIEDKIRRDQRAEAMTAERPDIQTFETYEEDIPDSTDISSSMAMDINDISDEADADLPADTISDNRGPGNGQEADPDDREALDGENYDPNSAEESQSNDDDAKELLDEEELKAYRKLEATLAKKRKMAKGQLRDAVYEERKVKPIVHSVVKKRDMAVDSEDEQVERVAKNKGKSAALEGFKKGWDKLPRGSRPAKPHSSTAGTPVRLPKPTATVVSGSGTAIGAAANGFVDEQPAAVIAARASKATALSQKGGTAKMGIALKKVEISADVKAIAIPQKKTYSFKDLPGLIDIENGTKRWQDEVMPIILAWASTLHDPFGINGDPSFEPVVNQAWDEVFEDEDAPFNKIVVNVAGTSVRTWRSQIGSKALIVLGKHLQAPEFRKQSSRAKFVEHQLDQCRYIYEDPEQKTGAYRAPLLLKVYAHHQRQVEGKTNAYYGRPVGALAFAATALERALKLWKGGVEVGQRDRPNFVRGPWAKRVQWHVDHIKDIGDRRWDKIEIGAAKHITDDDKGDSDSDDSDNDDIGSNVQVVFSDSEIEGDE